jgi:hypothetical protein
MIRSGRTVIATPGLVPGGSNPENVARPTISGSPRRFAARDDGAIGDKGHRSTGALCSHGPVWRTDGVIATPGLVPGGSNPENAGRPTIFGSPRRFAARNDGAIGDEKVSEAMKSTISLTLRDTCWIVLRDARFAGPQDEGVPYRFTRV